MYRFYKLFLKGILILLSVNVPSSLCAQIYAKRFEKDLYLSGVISQVPAKVISMKDSGLCISGVIQLPGQFYSSTLSRLDKFGNLLWSYGYCVQTDSFNSCSDIVNTFDNGIILAGCSKTNYYGSSLPLIPSLIKVDSLGNVIWSKSYPGLNGAISSVKELSDSSLALNLQYWSGSTPIWILQKLDKNGNILWSKKVANNSDLVEKSNKNLQIFSGGTSIYLKEFDRNGYDLWEKKYTNTSVFFNAWKMDVNKMDETIIISDFMDSTGSGGNGIYVLKTDSIGNILFSNNYSGNWDFDQTYVGAFTKDCGIAINSRIVYFGLVEKQGILKLDLSGNVQWLKVYPLSLGASANWVISTPDFGYASLGQVQPGSPLYSRIIKTDVNGKTPCNNDSLIPVTTTPVPLTTSVPLNPSSFFTIINSNVTMLRLTNSASIASHCSDVLRFDSLSECIPRIQEVVVSSELIIPNVFTPNGDNENELFKIEPTGYDNFRIEIYDRWGIKIFHSEDSSISWSGRDEKTQKDVSDGTYYYIISVKNTSKKEEKYKGFLTLIR